MPTIALLPMKAHSARVSGKNFREFAGKPLFRWILDTLLKAKEIDRIVINTDAREILAEKGLVSTDRILIRDRKPEICGDFVSMNLVIADDLENVPADPQIRCFPQRRSVPRCSLTKRPLAPEQTIACSRSTNSKPASIVKTAPQ